MIKFFVKHPVTTIMFVLFWVVMGIVSFPKMNIESTPAVDFPMVTASFVYPGAAPDEIESQVIKRAEDAISEVAGVKKITSQAFDNGGFVMAEFHLGVNVDDKANEVKAKVEALSQDFPTDLKKPVVEKLNPLQESVMDIVLTGGSPRDMDRFATDVLNNRITGITGVSSVSVFGGQSRAVRIFLDPDRMTARGVSAMDITNALGAQNMNVPGGNLESGTSSQSVRFTGEFSTVSDIENMQISTPEGGLFRLRDVATVSDAALDITTGARFNGQEVVILSVVKASDGNAIKISRELRKRLPDLQKETNAWFADKADSNVQLQIISDSSTYIQHETDITIRDIILGIILTVITLYVFTRNWRTTVIASVMIPASLVSGFFFMDLSGFTINTMTLIAMATALGTLITDAIVMIESALGLMNNGMSPEEAAIEGTKKVTVRIFATIGVHVVVFLPLAFMGGIAGQFMKQFGMTVVYLVLLSSMFSFTLTPMMIAQILRPTKNQKKNDPNKLSWFKRFYDWQIAKPWHAIGIAAAVLVLTAIPMRWVGNEFASSGDADEINISARAPAGSSYAKSVKVAAEIEKQLAAIQEIDYTSVKIGDRGVQNIAVKLGLKPRADRSATDKEIAQRVVAELASVPDAEIQVRAGRSMSAGISNDLVLDIYGADDATREKYAIDMIDRINQIPEIQSAVLVSQKAGEEFRFIPDNEKMKFWGISNGQAGLALRTALYGNDNNKYKEAGDEYPIVLQFAPEFRGADMFDNVLLSSPKGLVPLSELGRIENARASSAIYRVNKNRITQIGIDLGKSTIGPVQAKIESEMDNVQWAEGYSASFAGMSEIQAESTTEMGQAFLLAIILTFMVLAAIMNSWKHPFTIATSILTSFTGVFLLLFLSGATFNIAVMLSAVMLVGLAVNSNILLLEPTLEEMKNGVPAKKALWEQFTDKTRMLMMATIAVVAGLIPQLFAAEGTKVSMGAVIIGGTLAALFWTYALTPAIFMLFEKKRKKK